MTYQRPNTTTKFPFWPLALASMPLGGVIIYVGSCLSTGKLIDVQAVFSFLLILTICTLGVGTFLLILAALAIGIAILGPIWLIFNARPTRQPSSGATPPRTGTGDRAASSPDIASPESGSLDLNSDQQAVVDYITRARDRGFSDRQIIERLASQGWTENEITQGFQFANNLTNV